MRRLFALGIVLILAGTGAYLYFGSDFGIVDDLSDAVQKDIHADRSNVMRDSDVPAEEYEIESRTVNVSHEKTGAEQAVGLNVYRDPNFDFGITYPESYSYEIKPTAAIFRSDEMNMFFSAEVLLSENTGGKFSTKAEVRQSYIDQLDEPSIYFERKANIGGKQALDFAVKYDLSGYGNYINRFIIGQDENYFYVLQFNARTVEYENDAKLIDEIVSDFRFSGTQ